MKRADKAIWLTALRSGSFIQGQGALAKLEHGIMKYCCLGVECVVKGLQPFRSAECGFTFDGEVGVLPKRLAAQLGLLQNPSLLLDGYVFPGFSVGLAEMNDEDFTFAQIADMIEFFLETED